MENETLIIDRHYLWFISLSPFDGGNLSSAVRTAVNLARALASRNGVFVKTDVEKAPVAVSVDEIRLMHSIIDTILGSARVLGPGSVLHANCGFELHKHTLSFSMSTLLDMFYPKHPERLMHDVIERAYLERQHVFADFGLLSLH